MEALGFASDSSLGSLPLQAWAESCPHCRRGPFSVFWATPGCGWASADVLHMCWVGARAASIIGTRGAHPRMQEAAPCLDIRRTWDTDALPGVQAAGSAPALLLPSLLRTGLYSPYQTGNSHRYRHLPSTNSYLPHCLLASTRRSLLCISGVTWQRA